MGLVMDAIEKLSMLAQNEENNDGVNKLADYLNTIFEKIKREV